MAEQAVAPVVPNMGGQEAAIAGSQAIVFTATDRKIIEERGGKIDKTRSFLDVMKDKPLTPKVENEQTDVKPETDLKALEGRKRDHKRMLKHSALQVPREKVEIKNQLPDNYEESPSETSKPEPASLNDTNETQPQIKVIPENKEPQTSPAKVFDKLSGEQKNMKSMKTRVKEYHLKRLFTDKEEEFINLSTQIRQEALAAVKPEARSYFAPKLDKITLGTAQYKLNLLTSLEEMHLDEQHKNTIQWLKKVIASLSKHS